MFYVKPNTLLTTHWWDRIFFNLFICWRVGLRPGRTEARRRRARVKLNCLCWLGRRRVSLASFTCSDRSLSFDGVCGMTLCFVGHRFFFVNHAVLSDSAVLFVGKPCNVSSCHDTFIYGYLSFLDPSILGKRRLFDRLRPGYTNYYDSLCRAM